MNISSASLLSSVSFFAPPLSPAVSLARALPTDSSPFELIITFIAPEEIYKGGLEIYIPHKPFLYNYKTEDRYSIYRQEFYLTQTKDIPIKHINKGVSVFLYPVNLKKGEKLIIYFPLMPFNMNNKNKNKNNNISTSLWPPPQPLASPSAAENEYHIKLYNLQKKLIAQINRIPGPVYTYPGMISAVVGPYLQKKEINNKTLILFYIKIGDKMPPGRIKIYFSFLLNNADEEDNRGERDITANEGCEGWIESIYDILDFISCPNNKETKTTIQNKETEKKQMTGLFLYELIPSNISTKYINGWISLGIILHKPISLYKYINVNIIDPEETAIYNADHPVPSYYLNPCVQRYNQHLIKPKKTNYAAKLMLTFQIINCNNWAEPIKIFEGQAEPLKFEIANIKNLKEKDYISSVTIMR